MAKKRIANWSADTDGNGHPKMFGTRTDGDPGELQLDNSNILKVTLAAGGSNQAVTMADGANVTQGAKADAAVTDSTTTNSLMSFIKGMVKILADAWDDPANALRTVSADGSQVTVGAKADAAVTDPTTTNSLMSFTKGVVKILSDAWNDAANALRVTASQGTLTDRSGTIAAGDTAQQLAAANGTRRYLLIQNASGGDLWVDFTTTAVKDQPSIKLAAGASLIMDGSFVTTEIVSIIGATTGQAFTAKEA